MLIAVATVKGSAGASVTALGVAAAWPDVAVLVECDPDGGSLAYRFGHHPDPGLSSLAAACRVAGANEPLERHTQQLRLGVRVVVAPAGDVAAASVQTVAYADGTVLGRAARDATVVADLGRVSRGGPGMVLAGSADHVLIVVRPVVDELVQVQTRVDWLREQIGGRLWLVCAGDGPYSAKEIGRDIGVPVLGRLPFDRRGAGVLSGALTSRGWRRFPLPAAAARLAASLADTAASPAPTSPYEAPVAPAEVHR
jgi:MinD-like ATPase involved in chromosome partitioning or flagellar assembly